MSHSRTPPTTDASSLPPHQQDTTTPLLESPTAEYTLPDHSRVSAESDRTRPQQPFLDQDDHSVLATDTEIVTAKQDHAFRRGTLERPPTQCRGMGGPWHRAVGVLPR